MDNKVHSMAIKDSIIERFISVRNPDITDNMLIKYFKGYINKYYADQCHDKVIILNKRKKEVHDIFFYALENASDPSFYINYIEQSITEYRDNSNFIRDSTFFRYYIHHYLQSMKDNKKNISIEKYADLINKTNIDSVMSMILIKSNIVFLAYGVRNLENNNIRILAEHIIQRCFTVKQFYSGIVFFISSCLKNNNWLNYVTDINNVNSMVIPMLCKIKNCSTIDIINSITILISKPLAIYIIRNCDHKNINEDIWMNILKIMKYIDKDLIDKLKTINTHFYNPSLQLRYLETDLIEFLEGDSRFQDHIYYDKYQDDQLLNPVDTFNYMKELGKITSIREKLLSHSISITNLEMFYTALLEPCEITTDNLKSTLLNIFREEHDHESLYILVEMLFVIMENIRYESSSHIDNIIRIILGTGSKYTAGIYTKSHLEEGINYFNRSKCYSILLGVAKYLTNYVVVNYSYLYLLLKLNLYLEDLEIYGVPYDMKLFNLCALSGFYPEYYLERINHKFKSKEQFILNTVNEWSYDKLGYSYGYINQTLTTYIKKYNLDVTGYLLYNCIRNRSIKVSGKTYQIKYKSFSKVTELCNMLDKNINWNDSLLPSSIPILDRIY